MKIRISELANHLDENVKINGWVYNIRSIGKIWFLILRDGSGYLQCVTVKNDVDDEIFKLEETLTQESSVSIFGKIRKEPRSVGGVELSVSNIIVHQLSNEYPISKKDHGTDFLMTNRHLWLRSKKQNAILKIRHQVIKATRDFYDNNGFILVDSPILTANSVEGTSTLFELDYFDRSAYLTQSGQLYGESSAMAFGNIYVFGPTFRAEKSKTRRHLTEFWMVEPEMAYCDLEQNMDWAEKHVEYVVRHCLEHCRNELETLKRDIKKLENISGLNVITTTVDLKPAKIKDLCFSIASEIENLFLIIHTKDLNKVYCSCYISKNLVSEKNLNSSEIISKLSKFINGRGGGQAFYSTCAGDNLEGIQKLFTAAKDLQIQFLK